VINASQKTIQQASLRNSNLGGVELKQEAVEAGKIKGQNAANGLHPLAIEEKKGKETVIICDEKNQKRKNVLCRLSDTLVFYSV